MSSFTDSRSVTASAPAKVILLGEHAVNRGQSALVVAVDLRAEVEVRLHGDGYLLESGLRTERGELGELRAFADRIDTLRKDAAFDSLAALAADDFFAPLRYVLALVDERSPLPPLEVTVRSAIPVGAGFGSGSAVASALAVAVGCAAGTKLSAEDVVKLAWAGDTIAHGGIASALDASGCALGGVVRYSVEEGARRVCSGEPLALVVGDTGVTASTASVNARVRRLLARRPALAHLFAEIGLLVDEAVAAVESGDLERLGRLLNLNELVLERLGISCPEIDALVTAALEAGALGAKLSGSGGGGIVVALARPTDVNAVAAAIEGAGGLVWVGGVSQAGARVEPSPSFEAA